jgi:hypothetical protein
MQSSSTLLFAERSVVNTLMPSRSMGGQLSVDRGALTLTAGAFRTPLRTDAPIVDTDGDVSATSGVGYDLLARSSWRRTAKATYAEVQASVLAGEERGTLETPAVARLLSVGQQPLAAFRNDGTAEGTAIADGRRGRASVGGMTGTARLMLGVEAAHQWQQVRLATTNRLVRSAALSLRSAFVINGIRDVNQEITPRGGAGALEVGARAGMLRLTHDVVPRLLVGGSVREARTAGVAIGWIPTVTTRLTAALDVTTPALGGRHEHVAVMRWQQAF